MENITHPNLKLLSHSSDSLLHLCDRKYQIYKLRPTFGNLDLAEEDNGSYHLSFGSIVGIGVAQYLTDQNMDNVYWEMFKAWDRVLDDEEGLDKKKTFYHALMAIDRFKLYHASEFRNYDLVSFNGKPATELGFSVDCGDGYYYRGKLDALLFNRVNEQLVPFEIKTTGSYVLDEAMYKNSGQGGGYKLIVDAISRIVNIPVKPSYNVEYSVYQSKPQEWNRFTFKKTNHNLARWIKNIFMQKRRIELNSENNFWPMNGDACFNFNKKCKYFGACEMRDGILFGENMEKVEAKNIELDRISYEFHFKLEDLINMIMEG